MVTSEQLELALGSKRNWASQELVTTLNSIETDGAELVRENWLTHANVLREGTYTLDQYTTAIKYVSLKQMGHTNQQAYSIALAERYQELVAKGYDDQRISSHVSAYHKGALVQKLMAQSTVPLYMLYQDEAHKAIKTLVQIMSEPNASFKTRAEAADKLLTHVKRPEAAKIELEVSQRQSDGMNELSVMMRDLAQRQLNAIAEGGNVKDVANLPLNKREPILIEGTKVE
jgi:hypothetical protein